MNGALFPLWQVDRDEYAAVCRHLGLTPSDRLFERLSSYLAEQPFRAVPPAGFALHLARPPLTRFRVARLDLATRLFYPAHPARYLLNAVIALHECDGRGFREMAAAPAGAAAWTMLIAEAVHFAFAGLLTLGWLVVQAALYAPTALGRIADLRGRRVLVTGAGRGLGSDLMLHCLERGAQVVGVVRTAAARDALLARLPSAAPLRVVVADLARSGALVAALRAADVAPDSVDMAIACAGVKHTGASSLAKETVRHTFAINLFATVELAAWLLGAADRGPAGRATPRALVIVSSMGRWHGMHGSGGYNASKAALSIWGESLEMDLTRSSGDPVTVTVVEPGLFASGMTAPRGLTRWLVEPRRDVAEAIVRAGFAGRRTLRPPLWFAWLTWAVCLGGRSFRARLFGRVKPKAN